MPSDDNPEAIRVTVVDDDPLVAKTVSGLLQEEGWQVDVFHDPLVAAEHIEECGVDLIVSDYDMPELTGAAMVRRVRAGVEGPAAPAVLVTGDRRGVPLEDRAPFEAILEKPFDPKKLLKVIEYCLYVRTGSSARSGTRRRASVADLQAPPAEAAGEGSTD